MSRSKNYSNVWKIPYSSHKMPKELLQYCKYELLGEVLQLHNIIDSEAAKQFLEVNINGIHDPFLINDMELAVHRIKQAIANKEKVCVYGDYDVDGITSTCLLTDWFLSNNIDCISHIPDRFDEGYGLNISALKKLKEQGVTLVVTVDCGITAFSEIEYANSIGLDMIITDHHECHEGKLPSAVAVIDCKRDDNAYPNPNLAGVGVAFKLVCACDSDTKALINKYIDLVCIGTIADVVPLVGENRIFAKLGLEKIADSPRVGIQSLLEKSGVSDKKVNSNTISFTVAPKLNATGRLGNTQDALDLLMCNNQQNSDILADSLCRLNKERQSMETAIFTEVVAGLGDEKFDSPIVISGNDWHQGVIGIVASRLTERYNIPVIMISFSGNEGKGSCRSYSDFNLFDALSACSGHLLRFGGHALAAGLSIERDKLEAFKTSLGEYYLKNLPKPLPPVNVDLLITNASELSVLSVSSLERLEPFGNSNLKPVMCLTDVRIDNISSVGNGKHMKFSITSNDFRCDCIFFSHSPSQYDIGNGDIVDIAFYPQINEFHNNVSVQLSISALRRHDPLELCTLIMDGDEDIGKAISRYKPTREETVRVWHMLEDNKIDFSNGMSGIMASVPIGMKAEKFCIAIRAFFESGLIKCTQQNKSVFICRPETKVNLEDTPVYLQMRYID